MIEDFYSAIQNFKANKGRTILSLSGIMIGIACVIAITSASASLEAAIRSIFEDMNPNLIMAMDTKETPYNFKINDAYRKKLFENIPNLVAAYYVRYIRANAVVRETVLEWQEIRAVEYGWTKSERLKFSSGGDFSVADYADGNNKIIIGEQIAKWFFPEGNAVGKKIWFYVMNVGRDLSMEKFFVPMSFEVVGVLENTETSIGQTRFYLVIPEAFVRRNGLSYDGTSITFLAKSPEHVGSVKKDIKRITEEIAGQPEALRIASLEEIVQQFLGTLKVVTLVFGVIAGLSLLVGGIGIMNIMIVTVTERKQEIGIRKAIGASKQNIITQFLAEAITITGVGAVLGCIVGYGIGGILIALLNATNATGGEGAPTLQLIFDTKGMLIAVIVSVCIGVFFGLYPAIQAAKLDPILALENE